MPIVSVILPTFNRRDTILRAIESVRAQTLRDWELLVVDDGSTDATDQWVRSRLHDERVQLIRQENQGVSAARNTGLKASRGRYLAFLDSDDEFFPYHLALAVAFLESHPQEPFVQGEMWEDRGPEGMVRHYHVELSERYPKMARLIGSRMLDLPPGETDDHLRVYATREPIGAWGRSIIEGCAARSAYHYRGPIFEHLRFGYLVNMQPTVLRRSAWLTLGLEFEVGQLGEDHGFMAEFCRRYPANYLSVPACIKHELGPGGARLKEGHLATGRTAYLMEQCLLGHLNRLFYDERPNDPELRRLRGLGQYRLAHTAISYGERDEALRLLTESLRLFPELRQATLLRAAARLVPHAPLLREVYEGCARLFYALLRVHAASRRFPGRLSRNDSPRILSDASDN
jgi:glycosyltransferase involved in cell wall biosynthesis